MIRDCIPSYPNCLPSCPPCVARHKCQVASLIVATLALGILGAAYGICGFTALPQKIGFFQPLQFLNAGQLSAIILAGAAVTGMSVYALIVVRRQRLYVTLGSLETLDRIKERCQFPEGHFNKVRDFLCSGLEHSLDRYEFYYHLSSLSEHIRSHHPKCKEEWIAFLKQIDHVSLVSVECLLEIDCQYEYARMEGKAIDFKIEELIESKASTSDFVTMQRLMREAFYNGRGQERADWYFFVNERRPLVVRNGDRGEILAVLMLEEVEQADGIALYIHSLAREASVVRYGLTEKLGAHIPQLMEGKEFHEVYCEVDRQNFTAQAIYTRLGFYQHSKCGRNGFKMVYKPPTGGLNPRG